MRDSPGQPRRAAQAADDSSFGPLKQDAFRKIWGVSVLAAVAVWMNEVASAWLMLSLNPSPLWVALVQSASTLPVFLLGLPAGAVADIVDRKRAIVLTQAWGALVAALSCALVLGGGITPGLLLALVFANGLGMALRWPLVSGSMPELAGRRRLGQAIALNGVGMNASRVIGPIVGGLILSSLGVAWVFGANLAISLLTMYMALRWRRTHPPRPSREKLLPALAAGVRYMARSRFMRAHLVCGFVLFFHFAAMPGLLPVIARQLPGADAGTYTLLFSMMGGGAVACGLLGHRIRRGLSNARMMAVGIVLLAASIATLAFSGVFAVTASALAVGGGAWMVMINSLSIDVQQVIPDWVRARGAAAFQMAMMGGAAFGAACWGQVATVWGLDTSLGLCALSCLVFMAVATRGLLRVAPEAARPS